MLIPCVLLPSWWRCWGEMTESVAGSGRCPLCGRLREGDFLAEAQRWVAFFDRFPVSAGHALVVPRRHAESVFELDEAEAAELWSLLAEVRTQLVQRFRPSGFNIGVNEGAAAGQTVAHVHIHVIPRYDGDVGDPRGGVRWVIPERARYWEP